MLPVLRTKQCGLDQMSGDSAVNHEWRARERAWRGQRITAASDESHDRRYHNDHIADSLIAVQVLVAQQG